MAYDIIVVGARVAGASTAMLLARAGLRVLVLDRARFPSDTLSSHQVQLPGVALLRDWGLLDAVRAAGTPATSAVAFDTGTSVLRGAYLSHEGIDAMYSPRRTLLDQILVDAARDAGAEVRDGVVVDGLLIEGGRVTGVQVTPKGCPSETIRATLVVGADGKHSLVAREVGAREYRTRPAQAAACYGYFADVAGSTAAEVYTRPDRLVGVWPTNDGLWIVYLAVPAARFDALRGDLDRNFRAVAGACLGGRLEAGRQVEHLRATSDLPNTIRQPHGPGWVLVGDAGLVMDPITGQGIGNALRDATVASEAIVAGLGGARPLADALRAYHRGRDRARRPMFDLTVRLASFRPDPAGEILFPAIAADPRQVSRFFGVLAGTVPVPEFFAPANLRAIVGTRGLVRMAAARLRTPAAAADARV
jgi:2-polyprenyl-6-methoxyphenol hydroxylase-like FAD-dependent oxidoreductase